MAQQVATLEALAPGRAFLVSSDPSTHAKRIKLLEAMGATVVALMNVSGADPQGALGVYGRDVLPELRD